MSPLTRCAPPTQSEAGGHSMGEVAGWTFFVAVSNIFWYISLSGCETGAAVFITLAARRQWATKRGICHSRRVKSIQQSGCMLPASLVTQPSSSLSSCVYFQKIWLVWKDHRKNLPWTWRAEVFYFDGVKIRLRRGCRGLGGLSYWFQLLPLLVHFVCKSAALDGLFCSLTWSECMNMYAGRKRRKPLQKG